MAMFKMFLVIYVPTMISSIIGIEQYHRHKEKLVGDYSNELNIAYWLIIVLLILKEKYVKDTNSIE